MSNYTFAELEKIAIEKGVPVHEVVTQMAIEGEKEKVNVKNSWN